MLHGDPVVFESPEMLGGEADLVVRGEIARAAVGRDGLAAAGDTRDPLHTIVFTVSVSEVITETGDVGVQAGDTVYVEVLRSASDEDIESYLSGYPDGDMVLALLETTDLWDHVANEYAGRAEGSRVFMPYAGGGLYETSDDGLLDLTVDDEVPGLGPGWRSVDTLDEAAERMADE